MSATHEDMDAITDALADEEPGFEVTEEISPDEVGDLTTVKRDDTIPACSDVLFIVHKASVDVRKDRTEDGGDGDTWLTKVLRVQARVSDKGINEKGDFARKILFVDLPLVLNLPALKAKHERQVLQGKKASKAFNEKWWKDSLVDFKEFSLATGMAKMVEHPETGQPMWKMTGPINDDLLKILASGDVGFVANVTRRENVGMDRFENRLVRFRAPVIEESGE